MISSDNDCDKGVDNEDDDDGEANVGELHNGNDSDDEANGVEDYDEVLLINQVNNFDDNCSGDDDHGGDL